MYIVNFFYNFVYVDDLKKNPPNFPSRSIHPSIQPSKLFYFVNQLANRKMHILYNNCIYEVFSTEDIDALYSRVNEPGYKLKSFSE